MTEDKDETAFPHIALFKIRCYDSLSAADLDWLREQLPIDPRLKTVLLASLEQSLTDLFFISGDKLLKLFIEAGIAREETEYLLRAVTTTSWGEDGMSTMAALDLSASYHPDQRELPWIALRAGLLWDDLSSSDAEYFGKDLAWRARNEMANAAFKDPTLIPVIIGRVAKGYRDDGSRLALASLLPDSDPAYEWGAVEGELERLRQLARGISDPASRAKRITLGLESWTTKPADQSSSSDLDEEDCAFLKVVSTQNEEKEARRAIFQLSRKAMTDPGVEAWCLDQFAHSRWREAWFHCLIAQTDRPDIALKCLRERMAQEPPYRDDHPFSVLYALEKLADSRLLLSEDEARRTFNFLLCRPPQQDSLFWRAWGLLAKSYPELAEEFPLTRQDFEDHPSGFFDALAGLATVPRYREVMEACARDQLHDALTKNLRHSPSSWLNLLHSIGSTHTLPIALEIAGNSTDASYRDTASRFLTRHYPEREDACQRLLEQLEATGEVPREGTWTLAKRYHGDATMVARLQSRSVKYTRFDMVHALELLDDPYLEARESRREERFSALKASMDEEGNNWPWDIVHRLVLHFGDREETFQFLLERVTRPVEKPERPPLDSYHAEEALKWEIRLRPQVLKFIGLRWPADERVLPVMLDAMEHPWLDMRTQAAKFLTREYPRHPGALEKLEAQIGTSSSTFGEYCALHRGDPAAMERCLQVLETMPTDFHKVGADAPEILVRFFGPRKDLGKRLQQIQHHTPHPALEEAIRKVGQDYFRSGKTGEATDGWSPWPR